MILRSNLHTHSTYSDGTGSPEEMVQAAIGKGFRSLGFAHAWTPYDADCCIKQGEIPGYVAEVRRLGRKYAGEIEIYLGFEVDCHEHTPKEGLDFTIGSCHYLPCEATGEYYTFDYKTELFEKGRDLVAGGDIREMVRIYYDYLLSFAEDYRPDIIGHIDLITKLNKGGRYFDQTSNWYRGQIRQAAERVAATGCIVELNTGGIFRGYKEEPYPSREFLGMLRELDVPVMVSSDAHTADALDFWFGEAEALLRGVGYRSVKQLLGGRFVDVEL